MATLVPGSREAFNLSGLYVPRQGRKILVGRVTSGNYSTLFNSETGATYVVPAAKNFYFLGFIGTAITAGWLGLAYGDNDVGVNGAAPTNPVLFPYNLSTEPGTAKEGAVCSLPLDTNIQIALPQFRVPTGKYPMMRTFTAAASGMFIGVEI